MVVPGRKCCNRCYNELEINDENKDQKEAIGDHNYGTEKVYDDEFNKYLHFFEFLPSNQVLMKLSSSFNDLIEEELSNNFNSCKDLSVLTSKIEEMLEVSSQGRHFDF